MAPRSANSPDIQRLVDARPQVRAAVASGALPLPIEQLLEAQAAFVAAKVPEADDARSALLEAAPESLVEALAEPSPRLAEFCVQEHPRSAVRAAAIRHRSLDGTVLAQVAATLTPDLQRMVVQRQDAIADEPAILDALEQNPNLAVDVARRVKELKGLAEPVAPEPDKFEISEATDEEVEMAIEEVRVQPQKGEIDEQTDLSEGQIRLLPPSVKLRLARNAGVRLRNILVRDTNPIVAVSTLRGSTFTDNEIERVARLRSVEEEVLELISKERRWARKYPVRRALVGNPRTPVAISMRLLSGIAPRDLKMLRMDRNIPDPVRSRARQLYRLKVG